MKSLPFLLLCYGVTVLSNSAQAGKLAIVIDDVGYRPQTENQVLRMPLPISIAVLPNAPYAQHMANKAYSQGREVLIHLPMAPISKQPLERDTLQPGMSLEEIQRIISNAVRNVPHAVGMNNHMGSAMTSSLPGMQKVMQALATYHLYFLDSMTIGNSQSSRAAQGTGVRVLKRQVFLDDSQQEADIRQQFNQAIQVARRNGYAIAIGHPHPATVRVLQQMLPQLPEDIQLVTPSYLLSGAIPPAGNLPERLTPPTPPPFRAPAQCPVNAEPVPASRWLTIVAETVQQNVVQPALNYGYLWLRLFE